MSDGLIVQHPHLPLCTQFQACRFTLAKNKWVGRVAYEWKQLILKMSV
jgi:hypothetical protein